MTIPITDHHPATKTNNSIELNGLDFSHYGGCPYCKNRAVVKCSQCQRLTCEGNVKKFLFISFWKCAWCPNSGPISGTFNCVKATDQHMKKASWTR